MVLLYILSFISLAVQVLFLTVAIASGLYYLAELVEEYSVIAKKVITWLIITTIIVYVCLILFEDLPLYLTLAGLLGQLNHSALLNNYPSVEVLSPTFISDVLLVFVNHYLSFTYFASNYHPFTEVLGYFTLCLWVVPFALFISLSANDYVLPTTGERQPLLGDDNVVSDYFSRKRRKYGLLSLFTYAKESLLPHRLKKTF